MARHHTLGKTGETKAVTFLQEQGYEILERCYRYKRAEVDIIARIGKVLVFAEVKTRSSNKFGYPEEFVSARKEALFLEAAEEYIFQQNWHHDIRFDILSVTAGPDGKFKIHHIEDAFH